MIAKLNDLQRLSMDTYKKTPTKYSVDEANNAIRKAVEDACGGSWNYTNFMKNKWDVYQILIDTLSIGLGTIIIDQFSGFAETKDTNLGDNTEFIVEDNSLFRVASISDGNADIRRQKIYANKLTVTTEMLAVKIYADLELFMSGRIDWTKMINKVVLSFGNKVGTKIYNAIYGSYSSLTAPYAESGTFSEATLSAMIAHVEAQTGQVAVVYGTKVALGKITSAAPSETMKNELNLMGHYGVFNGTDLFELPQAHIAGTDTFAIADDFLLVVPNGEKIVKVVFEGEPVVLDNDGTIRNDLQKEYFFGRKVGVGVLQAREYGIYKLS